MGISIRTLHQNPTPSALARALTLVIATCCALMASVAWAPAWAQAGVGAAYPNKPVRIIVPSGAGSPGDFWARQIAARFPEVFGQALVVDNKPGGNGFIAVEAAARAPADGYTLFLATTATMVWNPWLFRKMPYRDVEDFTPVTLVSGGPLMLAVNAKLPVRTLGDLIALAKAKPGELNYGMPGVRSDTFVLMDQVKRATGINVVGVPYKARGADLASIRASCRSCMRRPIGPNSSG